MEGTVSNDYKAVQEALAAGADPRMMCETCPWTRSCVEPPVMSREEIDSKIKEAESKDSEKGKDGFVGTLLTAVMLGGRDINGAQCPVFTLRLRDQTGRGLIDSMKTKMKEMP